LTPDLILQQEFRGPAAGHKSLDDWYIQTYWPMMQKKIKAITNKMTVAIAHETGKRATFLNAQEHVKSMSSLQRGSASIAHRYAPSEAMCRYATLAQTLGASEASSENIKINMSKASIDRQMLASGLGSAQNAAGQNGQPGMTRGQSADKNVRWNEYLTTFCNPLDYHQGHDPSGVCKTTSDKLYNRDINYVTTMGNPMTLDITSPTATDDSIALQALEKNLYAHDLVNNMPNAKFDTTSDEHSEEGRKYMALISAITKRAIAENSFSSIAAMKAKGSAGSAVFAQKLMVELGLTQDEAKRLITDNPSYYAQMEALTRKMYQSPNFYVSLMEGPDNVRRQQTAMKSFELMQQRDMYKSLQRSEMLMATLLEIKLSRQQGGLDKKLGQGE